MQPKCILVSGNERRFSDLLDELTAYLVSIGCEVEMFPVDASLVLRYIQESIEKIPEEQPLLFLYHGHGSPIGWEGWVRYPLLARCLKRVKGELIVVNDTCYGLSLLKYLKRVRTAGNTSFIAPWDSEGVAYGGPTRDALAYWPQGAVVEEVLKTSIHSTDDGDVEVPLQLRWGAQLDHYFFPAQVT